ncbi:hypothetical protein CCY99_02205 [Helicobacter sp. 16-1353]|uniref:hypothetical protein n=1 Tax=Helicobacter sp. 16-1353 TaxID=2004996 RepID=UPI000DCCA412|nr:hypothetical protein [Helicobacter sp. 16-1353]RAX54972.1 hypothetical protein CCY99_02205 [Helicobacter sp. 16-1353]
MNFIVSIIGFGALFGIFPLILFYGGIFSTYFSYFEIKEFFNSFFMANFNLLFYAIVGLFSGFAIISKWDFLKILYLALLIFSSLAFIPSIGQNIGTKLFYKANTRIIINAQTYNINVIYRDKYKIYYNTKDNKKVERLDIPASKAINPDENPAKN